MRGVDWLFFVVLGFLCIFLWFACGQVQLTDAHLKCQAQNQYWVGDVGWDMKQRCVEGTLRRIPMGLTPGG